MSSSQQKGAVLYQEAVDACLGSGWYLYIFKNEELIGELALDKKSCYRLGRNEDYSDIHLAHESCSKQHAVLQFREHPSQEGHLLFLMDLKSTHGTFLNETRIEPLRFYELKSKDNIRFAASSREYLVMHGENE